MATVTVTDESRGPSQTPTSTHTISPRQVASPEHSYDGFLAGALPRDSVHCYILEEAQRAGKIDIAAVFEAPGGGPLYIYLRQNEPISAEIGAFFREKAHEYLEKNYRTGGCSDFTGDDRKHCLDELLGPPTPTWREFRSYNSPLPRSWTYERIYLYTGGPEARRTEPGWASWRQVWPSQGTKLPDWPNSSSSLNVSDVDPTNIPDPDCEEDLFSGHRLYASCQAWQRGLPEMGIAGLQYIDDKVDAYLILEIEPDFDVSTLRKKAYSQITAPVPEDKSRLDALANELLGVYGEYPWEVETVQVNYDFGQLWRWKVILDRFSFSASNTVGITGGSVDTNRSAYDGLWLSNVEPRTDDLATVRHVLVAWAQDPELAAAVLPDLLPQLGMPVDAVAIVRHDDHTPKVITEVEVNDLAVLGSVGEMDNAASDAVARDNIAIEGTGKVADAGPHAAPNGIVIWGLSLAELALAVWAF